MDDSKRSTQRNAAADSNDPPILGPTPRRPGTFSLTPMSRSSSSSASSSDHSPDPTSNEPLSTPPDASMAGGSRKGSNAASSHKHTSSLEGTTPQKSRSIMNLTASTLLGIYSPTGYDANRDESVTPWGTGAQTPARTGDDLSTGVMNALGPLTEKISAAEKQRRSEYEQRQRRPDKSRSDRRKRRRRSSQAYHKPQSQWRYALGLVLRIATLFVIGLAYGGIISHLHDSRNIAPVKVDINRSSWRYFASWGLGGVLLGSLLPWVDSVWDTRPHRRRRDTAWNADSDSDSTTDWVDKQPLDEFAVDDTPPSSPPPQPSSSSTSSPRSISFSGPGSSLATEWNPIVRSIGAFVGIAFAIRRLPWQSTLQVSLTLALVNPVLWYLIDRTRAGFALALVVALTGAATLISINPHLVPPPSSSSLRRGGLSNRNATLPRGASASASAPSPHGEFVFPAGLGSLSYETIGVATWVSSVFFVSAVCFGNIGRRLAAVAAGGGGAGGGGGGAAGGSAGARAKKGGGEAGG